LHLPRSVRRRIVYATVVAVMAGGLTISVWSRKDAASVTAVPAAVAKAEKPASNDPKPVPYDAPEPAAASSPAQMAQAEVKARPKVDTYMVVENDTVGSIAERFGLSVETILWANDLGPDDFLQIGQELKIPAIDGVVHVVQSGDTLWEIADAYSVDFAEIAAQNLDVDASALQPGDILLIPGAEPRVRRAGMVASRGEERSSAGGSFTHWPTYGVLTDYFGWRVHPVYGTDHFHDGMDIGVPEGTPVGAAARGRVTFAGWLGGYGLSIKIDHGDGIVTMYAHLSEVSVESGQTVGGGDLIGYSGNTGTSTGPHLHFTVFVGGSPVDPSAWLP